MRRRPAAPAQQDFHPQRADRDERQQIHEDEGGRRAEIVGRVHLALDLTAPTRPVDGHAHREPALVIHDERDELPSSVAGHR